MKLEDFLNKGKLGHEEKFEGSMANETVYLCYSSVRAFIAIFLNFGPFRHVAGYNGKAQGELLFSHAPRNKYSLNS
jgi:hypothetical protein